MLLYSILLHLGLGAQVADERADAIIIEEIERCAFGHRSKMALESIPNLQGSFRPLVRDLLFLPEFFKVLHHGLAARLIADVLIIRICVRIIAIDNLLQLLLGRAGFAGILEVQHHSFDAIEILVNLGRCLLLGVRLMGLDALCLLVPGFLLDAISRGR